MATAVAVWAKMNWGNLFRSGMLTLVMVLLHAIKPPKIAEFLYR